MNITAIVIIEYGSLKLLKVVPPIVSYAQEVSHCWKISNHIQFLMLLFKFQGCCAICKQCLIAIKFYVIFVCKQEQIWGVGGSEQ